MTTNKTHAESPAAKKPTTEHSTNENLQAALTELEGIRDDVRVRVHLAGMELKSVWSDLDRRYLALRDVALSAKDEAVTKAKKGLTEIRHELHDFRARLDKSMSSDAKTTHKA